MSPRARLSDIGAKAFAPVAALASPAGTAPVAALARPAGTAPVRYRPANDPEAGGRIDLLARRRRRHNRYAQRA